MQILHIFLPASNKECLVKYRPEIDGLRTVAVVPVIFFHAGVSLFSGGYVGVDIFFVISGYLISSILMAEIAEGQFSILRFYERRVRRILPALFTMMAVTIPFAWFALLPNEFIDYGKSLIAVPTFVSNILFWSERGYFGASAELKPLVHTWSLAVEEQFYIAFPPLLAFLATRRARLSRIAFITIFALSLTASWYLTKLHFETGFYLPVSRVWELLTGVACAVVLRHNMPLSGRLGFISTVSGLALILYAIFAFDSQTVFPGLAALVPVVGTALVILASPHSNPASRLLSTRGFVWIGLISYALYLWHQPVFAFLRHIGLHTPEQLSASLPLVVLASYLSYRFVETPVRRARAISQNRLFTMAAAASVAFIMTGAVIITNRGFIDRYPAHDIANIETFQELSDYSETTYNAAQFRAFDDSGRTKVIISGDSHARDFYNMVRESGLEDIYQFSTKRINAECGNLFTTQDLSDKISSLRQERCKVMGRLDHPDLAPLLEEADEIWLAARWFDWVVDLLPETITNLENTYNLKVRVFGPKSFGPMSLEKAISIPLAERRNYRQIVDSYFIDINTQIHETVQVKHVTELLGPLCGGDPLSCRVYDDQGVVITTDGGHLSPAGARYLAPKVRQLILGE
jgi:peptidoglycan/LPS O-acetylase OafA/YrhL